MASPEYINRLELAVSRMHDCKAIHIGFAHLSEVLIGETAWQGDVEILQLIGHPKTQRCYAWSLPDDQHHTGERFVTVLEIPPVNSPEAAVQFQLRKGQKAGHAR